MCVCCACVQPVFPISPGAEELNWEVKRVKTCKKSLERRADLRPGEKQETTAELGCVVVVEVSPLQHLLCSQSTGDLRC